MPSDHSSGTISPVVIRQAANWLVRLHSGDAHEDDHAACLLWRQLSAEHELAWQRAERLSQHFASLPPAVGVSVLTRSSGMNRRAALKTAAMLGATLPAVWIGYRYSPWTGSANDYRTRVGEFRDVTLADGSQLTLNTDTSLDVHFSQNTRLVQLQRGEIYVHTSPDPGAHVRPFVIETPQGRMRALGTRFVVRQIDGTQALTSLAVLEHRVELTLRSTGEKRIFDEGEEVRFTDSTIDTSYSPSAASSPRAMARPGWTRGALYADDMRLDAFLAELARYRPGIVRCASAVAGLRVSGVFQLADTDRILAVIGQTLPVSVVWRTKYWVSVSPLQAL